MARSTSRQFYWGPKWQKERAIYRREHPFCERCLKEGIYKPADLVHHKEYLDDAKAKDARIALNFDNLESLCADCHNKEHHKGQIRRKNRRWKFVNGELVLEETTPIDV